MRTNYLLKCGKSSLVQNNSIMQYGESENLFLILLRMLIKNIFRKKCSDIQMYC